MADTQRDESSDGLEEKVSRYLSAALEPRVGRADARFREFLGQSPPLAARAAVRRPGRMRGWFLGIAGAGLAASLGALLGGPSLRQAAPARSAPLASHGLTPVRAPMLVQQDVQSQMFDDGTYMANDSTPFHVLRRRDLERTRWFDQDRQLKAEEVVPSDHLVYVRMKTY